MYGYIGLYRDITGIMGKEHGSYCSGFGVQDLGSRV